MALHPRCRATWPPVSRLRAYTRWALLRGRRDAYHRSALDIALALAAWRRCCSRFSGDVSARSMAAIPAGQAGRHGGASTRPSAARAAAGRRDTGRSGAAVRWGTADPAAGSASWRRTTPPPSSSGLDELPRRRAASNVTVTHFAFQVMVGCGLLLAALGLWFWLRRWRRDAAHRGWLLRALAARLAAGLPRARGRLDRHRGGAAALDHLRRDAHRAQGVTPVAARCPSPSTASRCCTWCWARRWWRCCAASPRRAGGMREVSMAAELLIAGAGLLGVMAYARARRRRLRRRHLGPVRRRAPPREPAPRHRATPWGRSGRRTTSG